VATWTSTAAGDGIIVTTVADERTITHPAAMLPPVPRPVILGGPDRYLAGNAVFKWTVFAHWSWSRAVAIASWP
jgi:hypothetical protein